MTKPTTVAELFDYLEAHPWLRDVNAAGQPVFKAYVDRRRNCLWHGRTCTYVSFLPSAAVTAISVTLDESGFTVRSTITSEMVNEHRYNYEPGPEGECHTPTQESIPAAS